MLIIEREKMLDFWETEDGYAVISETSTFIEKGEYMEGYRKGVEAIYITYYDDEFSQLSKEKIQLKLSFDDSEVKAEMYDDIVYFVESNSSHTVVHIYNLQTKNITTSKNKLSARYDDFHIIKKQDGVIYHLAGLRKIHV